MERGVNKQLMKGGVLYFGAFSMTHDNCLVHKWHLLLVSVYCLITHCITENTHHVYMHTCMK